MFLKLLHEHLGDDPARLARALRGLEIYQRFIPRQQRPERAIRARQGKACLRQVKPPSDGPLLLCVPSLINPPHILDLDPKRSLIFWFARRGYDPLLLDWGKTDGSMRDHDLDHHITAYLVPLIESQDRPVHLVGYCLGGTLALAAACLTRVASLTLLAAPWDFAGYSQQRRDDLAKLWKAAKPGSQRLGLLPMEVLQAGFWSLAPDRVARKFEALVAHAEDAERLQRFGIVEDWANTGEPLSFASARQLVEDFYLANKSGSGDWSIGGTAIGPRRIGAPAIEIVSTTDEIVPHAARAGLERRIDTRLGHVGMVIGSGGPEELWKPLYGWLSRRARPTA